MNDQQKADDENPYRPSANPVEAGIPRTARFRLLMQARVGVLAVAAFVVLFSLFHLITGVTLILRRPPRSEPRATKPFFDPDQISAMMEQEPPAMYWWHIRRGIVRTLFGIVGAWFVFQLAALMRGLRESAIGGTEAENFIHAHRNCWVFGSALLISYEVVWILGPLVGVSV